MSKNLGQSARRLGGILNEFGNAFEAGRTQDLRIEVPTSGGVHVTGTRPRPTRSIGIGGGNNMLLLLGLAAVVLFAART